MKESLKKFNAHWKKMCLSDMNKDEHKETWNARQPEIDALKKVVVQVANIPHESVCDPLVISIIESAKKALVEIKK